MEKELSTTDSERESRKQRFNYILNFWRSRDEPFCPIRFIDFFTGKDTVSSKERVVRPVKRSPSPSPRRFSSRPPVGAYNLMACSSLCDLIDSNDVDLDSEVQTALGSASSDFYSCAGDGSGDFREIPEERSPWQRWRVVFLWLALACLGFVAVSTLKATSHLLGQSPRPHRPRPRPRPMNSRRPRRPKGTGGTGTGV